MHELTKEQTDYTESLMESWGAWVYSGRLEVREVNLIGKLMAKVNPSKHEKRVMCDDEAGMLIAEIMRDIKDECEPAHELLIQYYVYQMPKYQVAIRFFRKTNSSNERPCIRTYRNIADRALNKYRSLIYHKYNYLLANRHNLKKIV